jgi:ATP-dependent metalloprotease FtsH
MSQDLNKNSFDKNLKMMSVSAAVLVALFVYTIYRSSSHIEGIQYYLGLTFLFILLIASFSIRFYKDKIREYIYAKRGVSMPSESFESTLDEAKTSSSTDNNANTGYIEATSSNITFSDVAGISSIKEELEEVVDFLNSPKKYLKHDVKLPKGVLLVGPPGVGKTLIARAVAGEANVPFYYQSGASFVHIYVGMGAKRVKELFLKAKASAPAIIFIDEIDAVGKSRSGSSNDEREATLNELLTQMDGFEGDSGVLVIAATNKIEVLDEALLRAGRFDRRVFLTLPNIADRQKILELYLKNKNHNIDINKLSSDTVGFSSASLSTLINEALLNMIKREDVVLNESDIEIAKIKIEFGKEEQQILNIEQKEILAIYQATKAYVSNKTIALFEKGNRIDSKLYPSKSELIQNIKNSLCGSIGVEVIKSEPYAVNCKDISIATNIANEMVDKFNMHEDADVLLNELKNELRTELNDNKNKIIKLKDIMLENEEVTKDDIGSI